MQTSRAHIIAICKSPSSNYFVGLLFLVIMTQKLSQIIAQTLSLIIVGSMANMMTPPYYVKPLGDAECPGRNGMCKTLTGYLENASTYFKSSSTFVFLCGTHNLSSILEVRNATNVSLYGATCTNDAAVPSPALIQCVSWTPSGVLFTDCMNILIAGIQIANCWAPIHSAAIIPSPPIYAALCFNRVTGIIVSNVRVTKSRGFGIHTDFCQGETSIQGSFFVGNGNRYSLGGNARFVYRGCLSAVSLTIVGSTISNGRTLITPTRIASSGLTVLSWCPRVNVRLESITTTRNSPGGNIVFGMNSTHNSQQWSVIVEDSLITDGSSEHLGGGMLITSLSPLSHHPDSNCDSNSTLHSVLRVIRTKFIRNNANKLGAGLHLMIQESKCHSVKIEIRKCHFRGSGAALKISKHSLPSFYDHVPITKAVLSNSQFYSNSPVWDVGAVLETTNIENIHLVNCSLINNSGSAIRLQNSNLFLSGRITVENNTAKNGAAVKFYGHSIMFINSDTTVQFKGNIAREMGGAIFVQDSGFDIPQPCFFQPNVYLATPVENLGSKNRMKLEFVDNSANTAGSAIFGGEIDRCVTYGTFTKQTNGNNHSLANSMDVYHSIFQFPRDKNDSDVVSSNAYRILFCQDYTSHIERTMFPGQHIYISIVARGQLNGTAPAAISLGLSAQSQNLVQICSAQELFTFSRGCTNHSIRLSLLEKNSTAVTTVQLLLTIKHPHLPRYKENAHINVTLEECPWGFKLRNGSCSCYRRREFPCDIETLVVQRHSRKWIGCYEPLNGSCRDKPFVFAHECIYCKSVKLNITVDTIDSQCMDGRTGLVCGSCKDNHSMMLGTNNCRHCTDSFIGFLSLYLLAGMLLIVILTVCNVTVTTGYLNGLIFYANCMHTNQRYLFLNFYTYDIPRVAIAWLNLDLGIELCFYKGMNMYQKTWLQIGYVLYMLVLQVSIIILCRKYVICTRLFGRNVTKVLSTLLLLVFTKAGRIAVSILQSLRLHLVLPNKVWLMDPNIYYASDRHLPLFIVALLMYLLLLVFMLSLLFIQIITKCSGTRCFHWVIRLRPFFETFTGPCNQNFTFWPGLLLFGQILILSSSYLPYSAPLVPTCVISITLLVLSFVSPKGVYKKWSLNMLELSLLFNLFILNILASFRSLYMKHSEIVYVSIGFATLSFVTFQLVNSFKIIRKMLARVKIMCLKTLKKQRRNDCPRQTNSVTHSVAALDPDCDEQSPLIPAQILPPVVHFDDLREPLMQSTESENNQ